MSEVVLFHHALGKTAGVEAFADALRAAGHRVTVPDLFAGETFADVAAGVAHAEALGFDEVIRRGETAADALAPGYVVVGLSLGALPAQKLAQTRAGVAGAALCYSAVPLGALAPSWPAGLPLQIHLVADDPLAAEDHEAARELVADGRGTLYVYPGRGHLVADSASPDHDPAAAAAILERILTLLAAS